MADDFDPANELAVAVDDGLITPIFHEDSATTSSSSNSSGSPRRHDEWSLPTYFSPTQSAASPPKPGLLNMDDLSFASLLQSATANHMHPWANMDVDSVADLSLGPILTDDSQYAIDPSSLHFGAYAAVEQNTQPTIDTMFQFTVTQPFEDTQISQVLTPVPASTSSESRDTSPSPAQTPSPPRSVVSINPSELDLYAQRAREATGIVSAVKASAHQGQQLQPPAPITPVSPISHEAQIPSKVPIPRLRATAAVPRAASPPPNVKQSPKPASLPTPPATDANSPPQYSESSAVNTPAPQQLTKSGRPKTSHTTIERRYRTNLNARILALKRAVPALRILEKNTPQPQQGKGLTGASAPRWDFNDVINERGYVDGVKAAKKNSKGVVLGKAVEYIRALKRREARLKREADGLRALISGLVGGAELLNEWERDWRATFGGEEMDEVEEGEGAEEGDDEGDPDDDEDDEEDDGRAKKRKRGEPAATPAAPPAAAEKRKRGRPRKNPLPSAATAAPQSQPLPHLTLHPAGAQQPQQSTFYLGGILLFNFFWTDSASKTTAGHEGTVLTHVTTAPALPSSVWDIITLSRVVNFIALTALLVPLVTPYVLRFLTPPVVPVHDKESEDLETLKERLEVGSATGTSRALLDRLASTIRLGMKPKGVASQLKAWRVVAADLACRDAAVSTSFATRMHAYLSFAKLVRSSPRSKDVTPSDCITLAFLIRSFSLSSAVAWWDKAKVLHAKRSSQSDASVLEQIVLDLGLENAGDILLLAMSDDAVTATSKALNPVEIIAAHVVKERMNEVAREQFVDVVLKTNACAQASSGISQSQLIRASRVLGSQIAELGKLLDRLKSGCPADELISSPTSSISSLMDSPGREVDFDFGWSSAGSTSSDAGSGLEDDAEHEEKPSLPQNDEAKLFLIATVLYMRVCGSNMNSLTDSEKAKEALALRRTLANEVFDAEEVEEARDRVVDLLAECSS